MNEHLMRFISKLPSTNFRIFVSVILFAIVIVVALFRDIPPETLYSILGALLIAMGLDVGQFYVKRKTHIPDSNGDQHS